MRRSFIVSCLTLLPLLVVDVPVEAASPATGEKAPDFETKECVNGDPCSLKCHRGQVVFLEIFRTWCGPCNDQAPHLTALHEMPVRLHLLAGGMLPAGATPWSR
jgi:thiol-disulfide isomerase/thioredoxin